jgi:histidinol phosphatase-like enzyme
LIPGVVEAIARFSSAGFVSPVVTVQSRIAKGLWSLSEFEESFARFAAEFQLLCAILVGPYVCPHRFGQPCHCKKPYPSLTFSDAIATVRQQLWHPANFFTSRSEQNLMKIPRALFSGLCHAVCYAA